MRNRADQPGQRQRDHERNELFANGLLVLGLAIVAGSRAAPDGMMRFKPRSPSLRGNSTDI